MLTSTSSPVRTKQFTFRPNHDLIMKPSHQFADPAIVNKLMRLGDKLSDHQFCQNAVIATGNHSIEIALKWILDKMSFSKQTPYATPTMLPQSTSRPSPVLVAVSPTRRSSNNNNNDNDNIINYNHHNHINHNNFKSEEMECTLEEYNNNTFHDKYDKHIINYEQPPPLSIGKSSYNEDDDDLISPTTITITPNHSDSISLSQQQLQYKQNINNTTTRRTTAHSLLSPTNTNLLQQHTETSILGVAIIDDQEIIPLSPITPYSPTTPTTNHDDTSDDNNTPTPPSFGAAISALSSFSYSSFRGNNNNNNNNKINNNNNHNIQVIKGENMLNVLSKDNIDLIIKFLTPKERIKCALLNKMMRNVIYQSCNFNDVWLTFDVGEIYESMKDKLQSKIQLISAKSVNQRYYKNCINISMKGIQFVEDAINTYSKRKMVMINEDDGDDDDDEEIKNDNNDNNNDQDDDWKFSDIITRQRSNNNALPITKSISTPSTVTNIKKKKKKSVRFKKSKPKYASSNTGSNRRLYGFDNNERKRKSQMMIKKKDNKKRLKNEQLNNLWIWKYINCLELNSDNKMDEVFNSFEWELLCKSKLSKTIEFLSFDMLNEIMNPDMFNLISSYFPNLEFLKLSNWDYLEKYKENILEFFKLRPYHIDTSSSSFGSGWEKVESSLIKLKGIKFDKINENVLNLLCNNIILCNQNELNSKFVSESLLSNIIMLEMNKCKLINIAHLQIILNGCINIKYLSLCDLIISNGQTEIHKLWQSTHYNSSFGGYHSSNNHSNHEHSFNDRVSRKKSRTKSKSKSKYYQLDYCHDIPIIYIPKSVKFLKVCYQFALNNVNDDQSDDDLFEDSTVYLDNSSNHSTPVLFAMDIDNDNNNDNNNNNNKKHKKIIKKNKKNKISPLTKPPFYCNLSKCRKKLIEANVIINDPYLINQLYVNNMKSLKNIILNYSSAEHNRYLTFTDFCAFYSNFYENWSKKYTKNINIILNNSLYDSWKLSVNKQQISLFFNKIFNKSENEILKQQEVINIPIQNRFNIKNNSELLFIQKLAKCTDFFSSTIHN